MSEVLPPLYVGVSPPPGSSSSLRLLLERVRSKLNEQLKSPWSTLQRAGATHFGDEARGLRTPSELGRALVRFKVSLSPAELVQLFSAFPAPEADLQPATASWSEAHTDASSGKFDWRRFVASMYPTPDGRLVAPRYGVLPWSPEAKGKTGVTPGDHSAFGATQSPEAVREAPPLPSAHYLAQQRVWQQEEQEAEAARLADEQAAQQQWDDEQADLAAAHDAEARMLTFPHGASLPPQQIIAHTLAKRSAQQQMDAANHAALQHAHWQQQQQQQSPQSYPAASHLSSAQRASISKVLKSSHPAAAYFLASFQGAAGGRSATRTHHHNQQHTYSRTTSRDAPLPPPSAHHTSPMRSASAQQQAASATYMLPIPHRVSPALSATGRALGSSGGMDAGVRTGSGERIHRVSTTYTMPGITRGQAFKF